MNLTTLKAAAELAKTSNAELEIWQMEISPDDVLMLVEVARAALRAIEYLPHMANQPASLWALKDAIEGIEP